MKRKLFTSESVTEGHPDKMCDQIADAVLDAMLAQDPYSRVACEVMATTGLVFVTGEVTTECFADIEKIARDTIRDIGYESIRCGFGWDVCAVITSINAQSPDIAMGVDHSLEAKKGAEGEPNDIGAGDQGMMFGYACTETDTYMPLPIHLAHALTRRLAMMRKEGVIGYLRPDGKAQVTVEYEDDAPVRVTTVVVSTQHDDDVSHETIERDIMEHVVKPVIPAAFIDGSTKYYINPTGRFVVGGPVGDSGLTGRKIIVDTYGGYAGHGGGSFSGKDPTKVDRSASYMARYIAKNVVASGVASRCEVQLAYAIGVANPVSVYVNTLGTGKITDEEITELVVRHFDMRPKSIIDRFGLRRPIYRQTAAYGHFGRTDIDLPWEKTDMTEVFK